jgi:hypothetical protein
MALEDYMEPEVGVAVALTAAIASPGVRNVLRRGAVYGLAGILMAGDAVSTLAQGVKRGVQQAAPVDAPETGTPGMAADEASVTMPEVLNADSAEADHPQVPPPTSHAPKRTRKTTEVTDIE